MSLAHYRRTGWSAVAVAVVGLAITAGAAFWRAKSEDAEARAVYDAAAGMFFSRTQARLHAATQFVHSVAAFERLLGRLDKPTLDSYAKELDLRLQYPGFVALGFVGRAAASNGASRWPVAYVDPGGPPGRVSRGYDMGAEPDLRAVLDAARDSGSVAGSSRLAAWFGSRPGFILVHPLYAGGALPTDLAARRRLIAGFVFAIFDTGTLMDELAAQLPAGVAGRVLVDLSRSGRERVLYDSLPNVPRAAAAHRQIESVGGESWLLEADHAAAFADTTDHDRSHLLLALGTLTTMLATLVVWLFAGRGAWAEAQAKRMAAALQASEARYAEAVETTSDGLWERDQASGVSKVSPRFENLLGHAAGSFAREGLDPVELVHPADRFRLREAMAAHLRRDAPYAIELRMRHAEGHYLWVRVHGRAVRDESGRATRLVGAIADVTDLHRALERFRDLSQMASDWFWEQDENCRFTSFSDSMGRHAGMEMAMLLGKARWELPTDVDAEVMAAHRAQAESHQPFRDFEYRIDAGAGGWRWFRVSGKPRYDDDGRFIGYRGTGTDISAHKRLEEELRSHRDNLKALVEAQTADLVAAKEAAEQASLSKSEFLANMSHELRTPLHAILSFARIGHDKAPTTPPDTLRAYFDRVHASGERLLELLNNLLDLSKLEAGKMPIAADAVDLAQLAQEVAGDFGAAVEARSQRLQLVVPSCDTGVCGDAIRLAQVLRNLLSNALKFTPEGGSVAVEFAPAELPAGRRTAACGVLPALRMTIADDGVGIPEAELETVFDKFFQSSATRTGAGGTGLGLSICEEIVRAHRGTIRARNRPEGGAAIDVILPKGSHA